MIIHESPEIDAFWKAACAALNISETTRHYALPFCEHDENTKEDILEIIDDIGALAVSSLKRGTCHLAMQFEKEDVPMRNVDDYWIVVKTDGTPECVVKIIGINIVPFNLVGPEFAASEGPEGGLIPSHENWSNAHRGYFQEQCEGWGVAWREDHPVVCESFITVYSPDHPLPLGLN
ncbi:MAG: ASCH domain-containing protein [Rhodospirillales bacterium]|jgi:uncharacterized protein YhfF|nr:ASCH domain-containing protein [Rhodospirillales bacterium]